MGQRVFVRLAMAFAALAVFAGFDVGGFDAAACDAARFGAARLDAAGLGAAGLDAAGFDADAFAAPGLRALDFEAAGLAPPADARASSYKAMNSSTDRLAINAPIASNGN